MKAFLDEEGIVDQDGPLRDAAGQAVYNTSKFTLRDLRSRTSQQQLRPTSRPTSTASRRTCRRSSTLRVPQPDPAAVEGRRDRLADREVPRPVDQPQPAAGAERRRQSVKHPGLDNHAMGTVFEELVRRFNEENNEEAGEHWTPRDAVKLMAPLIFLPIADEIESGTYLIYDGACGTGGMLTVAEDTLLELAAEHGKDVSIHLYGQEINSETYAICKADLLLKGEGEAADNIVGGPEHSTLSNDAFPSREFDFMLSNPPYGKSWKSDLERMGGKDGHARTRASSIEHAGDAEYSLVTRSSDGQMLFLANLLSKMKHEHEARQPDRRGAQRQLALHRRRGPGREQHPPLDHRERLARGDRRPAAEHVLQHRHRDLRLGAHEPQAGAPPRQGAADRRDEVVQAAAQEPRQEELRALRRGHRADLRDVPRLRGDRGVEDLPERALRLPEGDGRAAAPAARHRARTASTRRRRSRR